MNDCNAFTLVGLKFLDITKRSGKYNDYYQTKCIQRLHTFSECSCLVSPDPSELWLHI